MIITEHPLHRSGRALLTHPALAFRVHFRAVKKRVKNGRRIRPQGLLRVAVRR